MIESQCNMKMVDVFRIHIGSGITLHDRKAVNERSCSIQLPLIFVRKVPCALQKDRFSRLVQSFEFTVKWASCRSKIKDHDV